MAESNVIVSRQQLYEMIWTQPVTRTANAFAIPYQELITASKRLDVPRPSSGYWHQVTRLHRIRLMTSIRMRSARHVPWQGRLSM